MNIEQGTGRGRGQLMSMEALTKAGQFQGRAFGLRVSYFAYGRMSLAGMLLREMAFCCVEKADPLTVEELTIMMEFRGVTKRNGDPVSVGNVYTILHQLRHKGLTKSVHPNSNCRTCWTITPQVMAQTPYRGKIY